MLIKRWSVLLIVNHCLWKCLLTSELRETTCVSANHLYSYSCTEMLCLHSQTVCLPMDWIIPLWNWWQKKKPASHSGWLQTQVKFVMEQNAWIAKGPLCQWVAGFRADLSRTRTRGLKELSREFLSYPQIVQHSFGRAAYVWQKFYWKRAAERQDRVNLGSY